MVKQQGRKQKVITELYKICKKRNNFIFDNNLVKTVSKKYNFANPFDATKMDSTDKLPSILKKEDSLIVHLGSGKHMFVQGLNKGFHEFEEIKKENIFDWKYRKSILNEFDTSESNILSVANNQRIIHDFLYDDIVANPKVYSARRTKKSITYRIGRRQIRTDNLQMEIDLTMELNKVITIFEGKNGFPKDFAIYQLFHPFKYYSILKRNKKLAVDSITACYVLRKKENKKSVLRLYNYTFKDENDMSSIKLLKASQYNLVRR